ncbi:MAG: Nif3-like dinuclear metal center hexameric protein, partial [Ferruginibacter sp.]
TTVFLANLKNIFKVPVVKHSRILKKKVRKIAICGGAGSFLTGHAIACDADIFITSDIKYHEFFDADDKLVLADIGHYESEQYTIELLFEVLKLNFPTFAVQKTALNSNPVRYLL